MDALAVIANDSLVEGERADRDVPWWSFTKTVIAVAALALVRDRRLALDEPIGGNPYTLRQLLQHRAGLSDYGALPAYHAAVERDEEPWPVPLMLERAEAERLCYEPGQGWSYSNIGYLRAGQVIEDAAGQDLASALDRLVLRPLGAGRARLARTRADLVGVALGEVPSYHPGWVYHGLLVGPLGDAALLLHRLMTGGFLPRPLLDEMRSRHPLRGPVPCRPWAEPGYGLGLMAGRTRFGSWAEGHTGGGPGCTCAIYHCAEHSAPVTVATFSSGTSQRRVESAAFRRCLPGRKIASRAG